MSAVRRYARCGTSLRDTGAFAPLPSTTAISIFPFSIVMGGGILPPPTTGFCISIYPNLFFLNFLMEKKDRPYTVLPYDPRWVRNFKREKRIIASAFKNRAIAIEHIGSTSVKGMRAKPQIDILVTVPKLGAIDQGVTRRLRLNGYTYHRSFNEYRERYFTRDAPSGERLVSVHSMRADNPRARAHLDFRDYLRTHPKDRNFYSKIKKNAYESGANRAEYPGKKAKVLQAILARSRKWANSRSA